MMNRGPYGFALLIAASVLFACGGLCMKFAMKRAEMGVIYLFVLGLEALAAFALSIVVAGERVTISKIAALVLIVSGIALLDRA